MARSGQFADLRAIGVVQAAARASRARSLVGDCADGADWQGAMILTGVSGLGEPAVVVEPPEEQVPWTRREVDVLARRTARLTGLPLVRRERVPFFAEPSTGTPAVEPWKGSSPATVETGRWEELVRRLGLERWVWVLVGECDPDSLVRRLVPSLFPDLLLVVGLRDDDGEGFSESGREDVLRHKLYALAACDAQALSAAGVKESVIEWWLLARLGAGLHWKGVLWRGLPGEGVQALEGLVAPDGAVLFADPPAGNLLNDRERMQALGLARFTVETLVRTGRMPVVSPASLPLALLAPRACFVTLTRHGVLRGCIGHLTAQMPLYQAVMENARNAALYDYRFEPVAPSELGELTIEISVLTRPRPLEVAGPEELLRCLEPGRDGVILHVGPHAATFLPQVWEKLRDPRRFMEQLSLKAGCAPDAWRSPDCRVEVYRVEAFSEPED